MRCPDCQKFVSFEQQDPEVEIELSDDRETKPAEGETTVDPNQSVSVQVQVRCVLACAECGTELKESSMEETQEVEIEGHIGDGHVLEVEESSSEATSRTEGRKGAPARYTKTFYGAQVNYEVRCSCNGDSVASGEVDLDEQASSFDELV